MAQELLLAASALLCLVLGGSALQCRQCVLDEPNVGCLPGATECTSKPGHPCMAISISYRGEVQYFIRGCIEKPTRCGMVKESLVPEYLINVTCCSHAAFCNDFNPLPLIKGGRGG